MVDWINGRIKVFKQSSGWSHVFGNFWPSAGNCSFTELFLIQWLFVAEVTSSVIIQLWVAAKFFNLRFWKGAGAPKVYKYERINYLSAYLYELEFIHGRNQKQETLYLGISCYFPCRESHVLNVTFGHALPLTLPSIFQCITQ